MKKFHSRYQTAEIADARVLYGVALSLIEKINFHMVISNTV